MTNAFSSSILKFVRDQTVVKNKHDNLEYAISTVPLNKVRKVTYDKDRTINAAFKAETAVFRAGHVFSPVALIWITYNSPLSHSDLHDLICKLTENEKIDKLSQKETYLKLGYVTSQQSGFNIWQMKKKSIIYILF